MPLTMVQKTTGAIIILTILTKASPSGFKRRADIRPEMADQDADGQTDHDLEIERLIELLGLVRGRVQDSGLDTH